MNLWDAPNKASCTQTLRTWWVQGGRNFSDFCQKSFPKEGEMKRALLTLLLAPCSQQEKPHEADCHAVMGRTEYLWVDKVTRASGWRSEGRCRTLCGLSHVPRSELQWFFWPIYGRKRGWHKPCSISFLHKPRTWSSLQAVVMTVREIKDHRKEVLEDSTHGYVKPRSFLMGHDDGACEQVSIPKRDQKGRWFSALAPKHLKP